jgi:hypothetical protein
VTENPTKVFISYSWDSEEHKEEVLRLANTLRNPWGIETDLDQYVRAKHPYTPAQGWDIWMEKKIEWAEFALVVCTETYKRRFRGDEEPGIGRGVTWEGTIIRQTLYNEQLRDTKFIPVVFSAQDLDCVPIILNGHDKYIIEDAQSFKELCYRLRKEPTVTMPDVARAKLQPPPEPKFLLHSEPPAVVLNVPELQEVDTSPRKDNVISSLITDEEMNPILPNNVYINVNLTYSCVTEKSCKYLQEIDPEWKYSESCQPPDEIIKAFKQKNDEKNKDKNLGIRQETSLVPLIRLIAKPFFIEERLYLTVAPLSFDLYSVSIPYPDSNIKNKNCRGSYIPNKNLFQVIENYKNNFSKAHHLNEKAEGSYLNVFVPLGLEALIITKDNYALLRCRDKTSTTGAGEWDVSFSGYARFDKDWCVDTKKVNNKTLVQINLSRWIEKEFFRETGVNSSYLNLEEKSIVGIHKNGKTGAIDILACFEVNCYAEDIAEELDINHNLSEEESVAHSQGIKWSAEELKKRKNDLKSEFKRSLHLPESRGAFEHEVHRTSNLFIPFEVEEIHNFLKKIDRNNEKMLPEARQAIIKALKLRHGI